MWLVPSQEGHTGLSTLYLMSWLRGMGPGPYGECLNTGPWGRDIVSTVYFLLLSTVKWTGFQCSTKGAECKSYKSGVFRRYCSISFTLRSHSSSHTPPVTSFHRKQHRRTHYIKFTCQCSRHLDFKSQKIWRKLVTQTERGETFEIRSAGRAISPNKIIHCQVFITSTHI